MDVDAVRLVKARRMAVIASKISFVERSRVHADSGSWLLRQAHNAWHTSVQ